MLLLRTAVVLCALFQVGLCSTADKIVAYAKSQIGSHLTQYPDNSVMFINFLIMHVGLRWPGYVFLQGQTFISAREWSDPHSKPRCWHLCTGAHVPGDLLAENNHVAVVTGNGLTTGLSMDANSRGKIVEDNWGFRSGQHPTCWRVNTDSLCSHLTVFG